MRREVRAPQFAPQDMGAATENLLLEAAELGLGAVWMGVCPEEGWMSAVAQVLNIPESIQPFAMVACGYPAEEKDQADRYDPPRVHWERW